MGPGLDQYAPQEMAPILKQWRARIASRIGDGVSSFGEIKEAEWDLPSFDWPVKSAPSWNEEGLFVDIDKRLFSYLRLPALELNEFSPTTASLLGLDKNQQEAVLELYNRLKGRFFELQYRYFRDVEPEKGRYVILAFPDDAAELEQEWLEGLKDIVGVQRTGPLDRFMRIPSDPSAMMRKGVEDPGLIMRHLRHRDEYPQWLEWGQVDIEIELEIFDDERGRKRFEVKYSNENNGGGRGSGDFDRGLPIRIRDPLNRRFQSGVPPAIF